MGKCSVDNTQSTLGRWRWRNRESVLSSFIITSLVSKVLAVFLHQV